MAARLGETNETDARILALVANVGLTRRELPAYLRDLLRQTAEIDDERLLVRCFSIAGLRVKVRFSDAGLADLYTARLTGLSSAAFPGADLSVDVVEAGRLGLQAPARWEDQACSADLLERELQAAGLQAAYPYQGGLWQVHDDRNGAALQFAGAVCNEVGHPCSVFTLGLGNPGSDDFLRDPLLRQFGERRHETYRL